MKRKTLTLVLCLLTVMSLVGVGFASWVISADTSAVETGNIVVDTVTDQRYSLTLVSEPELKNIVLTGPEQATEGWLTYNNNNSKGTVNLTVAYTFSVTKNDGTAFTTANKSDSEYNYVYLSDLNINVAFNGPAKKDGDNETAFGKLISQKVIKEIGTTGYTVSNVSLSNDNKTATFTVTVGYAWGDLFNNLNPFTFYNDNKNAKR